MSSIWAWNSWKLQFNEWVIHLSQSMLYWVYSHTIDRWMNSIAQHSSAQAAYINWIFTVFANIKTHSGVNLWCVNMYPRSSPYTATAPTVAKFKLIEPFFFFFFVFFFFVFGWLLFRVRALQVCRPEFFHIKSWPVKPIKSWPVETSETLAIDCINARPFRGRLGL